MGLDFKELTEGCKKTIEMRELAYKYVAIDAMNILHQFLASIRQYDGTPLMDSHGNMTGHLSGLFYRNVTFLENNIKPVYVFDGEYPHWKAKTQEKRMRIKKAAEMDYLKALEQNDVEAQAKYASRTGKLTSQMVEESKRLLNLMGIPFIEAPSEGEAQASVLCKKNLVYATVSQDYDSLVFGSPKLLRNLSITGRRKTKTGYIEIKPETIDLKDLLTNLGIDHEKLIWIAVLIGTDFNTGINGIGPKKALKLVKKYEDFHQMIKQEKLAFEEGYDTIIEIMDFFRNPPALYDESLREKIRIREPDVENIVKFLCESHDFSEERVRSALGRLKSGAIGQSRLNDFFE